MSKQKAFNTESGNTVVIALVVLVVVAVGALAFFSGKLNTGDKSGAVEPASGASAQQVAAADGSEVPLNIEPGNPVVAKVGSDEVTRVDVFNYIQTLPPQTRQLPIARLFPVALEQVINARVIGEKTKNVRLDNDPEVKKQLEQARKNIVRTVYIQNKVAEKTTDERLKQAYELYKSNFPEVEEVKARHILVKEESEAKDIIKQLKDGGDFAALAQEHSTDGTAEKGGELGYFAEGDVVPEFAKAAFGTNPGEYTKKPVKTDFGFHVIEIQEKRQRPPADYETAKPFLETQLRRAVLDEVLSEWRDSVNIERFDINGKPIEPAAGQEEPAPPAQ